MAGFGLGWIWSSVVSLGWVGLAAAAYGGLDTALDRLKGEPWAVVPFAGFFASVPASLLGGLAGPLAAGPANRVRRPVLTSSACGAGVATVLSVIAGLLIGLIAWQSAPYSLVPVWAALGLSVPTGLFGGWLGGRWVGRT